jgi:hypothetical protein
MYATFDAVTCAKLLTENKLHEDLGTSGKKGKADIIKDDCD